MHNAPTRMPPPLRGVTFDELIAQSNMLGSNLTIATALHHLNVGASIDIVLLTDAFNAILCDPTVTARDAQLGAFLSGLMVRGPKAEEVVELIKTALSLDQFKPIKVDLPPGEKLVCVAGSGKKGFKTMNVSTVACIVAASLGAYVAKPGSCSTSSVSGSSDFARIAGIHVGSVDDSIRLLKRTGLGLFSIENLIPNFDSVYGQRMFAPTPLSFAFPALLCPVQPDAVLYGLSHPEIGLSLKVFEQLGYDDVMVVSSTDDGVRYIDELGLFGENLVGGRKNGKTGPVSSFNPLEELGLPPYRVADIAAAATADDNVNLGLQVLGGQLEGARRDIIAINAAAILYLAGKVENRREGFHRALAAIKSGQANEKRFQCEFASEPQLDMLASLTLMNVEDRIYGRGRQAPKGGRLVRKLKGAARRWSES